MGLVLALAIGLESPGLLTIAGKGNSLSSRT
jgi:hypothetical protein